MTFYKRISAFVLISCLFACTSVLALGAVTISPMSLDIEPGEAVSFTAVPLGSSGSVNYEWYIDGLLLSGVTTSSLDLNWGDYTAIFPADITMDATRSVTVVASDTVSTETGSAVLEVHHPLPSSSASGSSSGNRSLSGGDNYCGDGTVRLDLGEFCDDGNGKKGDGCTMNFACEDGWTCSVDETGEKSIIEKNPEPQPESSESGNGNGTGDGDGEMKPKRSIIDILAEKNRDPLRLSEDAPLKAYMPADAPKTGVSLEMLHEYNKLKGIQTPDQAPDMKLLRPIAPKSTTKIVHPASLPNTGLVGKRGFGPSRVINI